MNAVHTTLQQPPTLLNVPHKSKSPCSVFSTKEVYQKDMREDICDFCARKGFAWNCDGFESPFHGLHLWWNVSRVYEELCFVCLYKKTAIFKNVLFILGFLLYEPKPPNEIIKLIYASTLYHD